MKTTLLIIGSGYVGSRLARHALSENRAPEDIKVVVTTRDPSKHKALSAEGVEVVAWDILEDDPGVLAPWFGEHTTVVYSIPTLFKSYESPDELGHAQHLTPVRELLACARAHGAARLIYLSSTSVYGDHDGQWVDETTGLEPTSALGKMRRDIEALFLAQVWTTRYVARIVGIYGPGRTLFNYIKSGRYKLVDGGQKRTNRVHVDDIVQSIWAIMHQASFDARVYNICDGHPITVRELVSFLVSNTSLEWPDEVDMETYASTRAPSVVARWKNSYQCDGSRLRDELGVMLLYPTVLDGYQAMLDDGVFG